MKTFTVTAEPTPTGWWVLEVDGVGVSQVRRLAKAADEMREAISMATGLATDSFDVDVQLLLPESVRDEIDRAESLQLEAERLQGEAAAARRKVARDLTRRHLSVRDIGIVMRVSPQRVSQLVNS